jgi:hypothetical protein
MFTDVKQWFAEMDRFKNEPFMPEGRKQSLAPIRQIFK